MSNKMHAAEIQLWDLLIPLNKENSKINRRIARGLKRMQKITTSVKYTRIPSAMEQDRVVKADKSTIHKPKRKPFNQNVFMLLSSSTLGFVIGVMISLFL